MVDLHQQPLSIKEQTAHKNTIGLFSQESDSLDITTQRPTNTGLVTSFVDFLEMETWAALRGPEMLHSFLPPQLKICHGNPLEPFSPAALKIHVNSQPVRENRTALCDKNSPKDTSWGCG